MTSKNVRVTEETHMKLTSIMETYGYKTFGDAITFCVNEFFLKDEQKDQGSANIQRDERDIDEINFLRELAITQAKSQNTVNVNVAGGGSFIPMQPDISQEQHCEEKHKLTDEEIEELKKKFENEAEKFVDELDNIAEATGGVISPKIVSELSGIQFDETDETPEKHKERMMKRLTQARKGKLIAENEVLNQGIKETMEETKELMQVHPSGLPPPPGEQDASI